MLKLESLPFKIIVSLPNALFSEKTHLDLEGDGVEDAHVVVASAPDVSAASDAHHFGDGHRRRTHRDVIRLNCVPLVVC